MSLQPREFHFDRATLNLYHDGEGPEELRLAVEDHLAECDLCCAQIKELETLSRHLGSLPDLEPPAHLFSAIDAAIEREVQGAQRGGSRSHSRWWGNLAASFLVVTVVGIAWWSQQASWPFPALRESARTERPAPSLELPAESRANPNLSPADELGVRKEKDAASGAWSFESSPQQKREEGGAPEGSLRVMSPHSEMQPATDSTELSADMKAIKLDEPKKVLGETLWVEPTLGATPYSPEVVPPTSSDSETSTSSASEFAKKLPTTQPPADLRARKLGDRAIAGEEGDDGVGSKQAGGEADISELSRGRNAEAKRESRNKATAPAAPRRGAPRQPRGGVVNDGVVNEGVVNEGVDNDVVTKDGVANDDSEEIASLEERIHVERGFANPQFRDFDLVIAVSVPTPKEEPPSPLSFGYTSPIESLRKDLDEFLAQYALSKEQLKSLEVARQSLTADTDVATAGDLGPLLFNLNPEQKSAFLATRDLLGSVVASTTLNHELPHVDAVIDNRNFSHMGAMLRFWQIELYRESRGPEPVGIHHAFPGSAIDFDLSGGVPIEDELTKLLDETARALASGEVPDSTGEDTPQRGQDPKARVTGDVGPGASAGVPGEQGDTGEPGDTAAVAGAKDGIRGEGAAGRTVPPPGSDRSAPNTRNKSVGRGPIPGTVRLRVLLVTPEKWSQLGKTRPSDSATTEAAREDLDKNSTKPATPSKEQDD